MKNFDNDKITKKIRHVFYLKFLNSSVLLFLNCKDENVK